ncbi:hypothetical protein NL676_031866 [Syzygium grande]|nr:hypothetical protein NL676_031866 [Syzygium grande]
MAWIVVANGGACGDAGRGLTKEELSAAIRIERGSGVARFGNGRLLVMSEKRRGSAMRMWLDNVGVRPEAQGA